MSNWAFVDHATNQLMRPRPGDSKGPTLWPSEASATYTNENGKEVTVGKCRRAIFYRYLIDSYNFDDKYKLWSPLVKQLKRDSKPVDKYMLWIWAAGDQAETFLIDQAKKSGVYISEQVPVYVKDYNISGKKDIEVINPTTQKISIVEAKSVYGFGANAVLGTESERRRGAMGTPRDSNLMQIAIYHWWSASLVDAYEESRLVYIARDTGRYSEYLVRTVTEDDTTYIEYRPWHPYKGIWTRVPYTIDDILKTYRYIQLAVDGGFVPPMDFEIKWSPKRIEQAYVDGELGKSDATKYEKAKTRKAYNEWVNSVEADLQLEDISTETLFKKHGPLIVMHQEDTPVAVLRAYEKYSAEFAAEDKETTAVAKAFRKSLTKLKVKKELKELEKGDWQCRFCKFAPICYSAQQQNNTEVE